MDGEIIREKSFTSKGENLRVDNSEKASLHPNQTHLSLPPKQRPTLMNSFICCVLFCNKQVVENDTKSTLGKLVMDTNDNYTQETISLT